MNKCKICNLIFANKSNLNRHVAVAHPREDSDEEEENSYFTDDDELMNDSDDNNEDDDEDEDVANDDDFSHISKEEATKLIWKSIADECNEENSFLEVFKEKVMFSQLLKRGKVYQAVMETLRRAQDEDDMDFMEALDFAVDKRKFLIERTYKETE